MSYTTRFALTRFGGSLGGSIADNGARFTAVDPEIVARVLMALEGHLHQGGPRLGDPSGPAALALATTNGALAANTTFYYRVAYRDQYGLETAASPEVAITTPGPVLAPSPAVLLAVAKATGAPGLRAGQYLYALSSLAADGNESTMGSNAVLILDPGRDAIQLTLPAAPVGAATINLWRQGPGEFGFTKIGNVVAGTSIFLDSGETPASDCACDPQHLPPLTNTTSSTNSITVTAPDPSWLADDSLSIQSWVIYRTTRSGVYPASSLVAEVVAPATAPATGLVATYIDAGGALATGAPSDVSATLTPSQPIPLASPATLPDITTTRVGTALLVDGRLWVAAPGPAWKLIGLWGADTTLPDLATVTVPEDALFLKTDEQALYAVLTGVWTKVGGGGGTFTDPGSYIDLYESPSIAMPSGTQFGLVSRLNSSDNFYRSGFDATADNEFGVANPTHPPSPDDLGVIWVETPGRWQAQLSGRVLGLAPGDVVECSYYAGQQRTWQYVVPPGKDRCAINLIADFVAYARMYVAMMAITAYKQDGTSATLDWWDMTVTMQEGAPASAAGKLPGIPTDVTATPVDASSVTVAWTPPTFVGDVDPVANLGGAIHVRYEVYCNNIRQMYYNNPASPTPNQLTVTGLSPDTDYTFSVKALNRWGLGDASASVTTHTMAPPPPPPPTNVTVVGGTYTDNLLVSWTPPTPAPASYRVIIKKNGVVDAAATWTGGTGGTGFTTVNAPASSLAVGPGVNGQFTYGASYTAAVQARYANGTVATSADSPAYVPPGGGGALVSPPQGPPNPPVALTSTVLGGGQLNASWTLPTTGDAWGRIKVWLQRGDGSVVTGVTAAGSTQGDYPGELSIAPNATSIAIANATPGSYTLYVETVNGAGGSWATQAVTVT